MPRPTHPAPRTAAPRAALALALALAPAPARAGAPQDMAPGTSSTPGERDLAYERAVQAEAAGDDALAAAGYARAYALTPAAETGPRLLFLRAGVAAHLRVPADAPTAHLHRCQARELLRAHLRDTPDALPDERRALADLERQIAAGDDPGCEVLAPPPPDPTPPPAPTEPEPAARPEARPEPSPAPAPAPTPPRPRAARPLQLAGGLGLGLGAASFALMGAGIVLADRAGERGRELCWQGPQACNTTDPEVIDILADGRRADTLVRVGATLGALATLAGVALLVVGTRLARRPRLAAGPGTLGLRF